MQIFYTFSQLRCNGIWFVLPRKGQNQDQVNIHFRSWNGVRIYSCIHLVFQSYFRYPHILNNVIGFNCSDQGDSVNKSAFFLHYHSYQNYLHNWRIRIVMNLYCRRTLVSVLDRSLLLVLANISQYSEFVFRRVLALVIPILEVFGLEHPANKWSDFQVIWKQSIFDGELSTWLK